MQKLRILLLPLGWLYGIVTFVRNKLFDWKVLSSHLIEKKSIVVGNLSVGGTGKSPLVEFIIRNALEQGLKVATLSRGYGRKTKGLIHADLNSTADQIGDEPAQFKSKFQDQIEVIVAEKRVEGVHFINNNLPETDLIVLDDAFQHRAVKAGLYLLVTPYNHLFVDDFMLPAGNLREWKSGKKRADAILVSKCPTDLSEEEKQLIRTKLKFPEDKIFFSSINYQEPVGETFNNPENILLVTGIGNPKPLIDYWKTRANVTHIGFGDHHIFSELDLENIHEKNGTFADRNKVILTTEKDFMRLKHFDSVKDGQYPWNYQPINLQIHELKSFKHLLDGYTSEI